LFLRNTMKPVAEQLKERLLAMRPVPTLAVAESLTAGCLQALVASVDGASGYFLGGVTCYTVGEKARLLGVDAAEACAGVSPDVAMGMARGVMRLFGSDIALATTGYATPGPGRAGAFAFWALVMREADGRLSEHGGRFDFRGLGRNEVRQLVARLVVRELGKQLAIGNE
jgi:nicotinamide-nucleotide amidase